MNFDETNGEITSVTLNELFTSRKGSNSKRKALDEATKRKISKANKGKTPWNKGKTFSPKKNDLEEDFSDTDGAPAHTRLTANGGYAHIKATKRKISKANTGNTPWNKGKTRSVKDKAKISAGVRARNRANLLKKLDEMGNTEEEWLVRQKKLKLEREIIRKRKCAAAKLPQKQKELEEKRVQKAKKELEERKKQEEEYLKEKERIQKARENERSMTMRKDFEWTPHEFDSDATANQNCPLGGPRGLICCAQCTASYSQYLSSTTMDMETQTISEIGQQLTDIIGFLRDAHLRLREKMDAVRSNNVCRSHLGSHNFSATGIVGFGSPNNLDDETDFASLVDIYGSVSGSHVGANI